MTKEERELMQMALSALKEALDAIESWGSYASGYFQVKHDLEGDIEKTKTSITAIEKCLANDALEKKAENARELGLDYEPEQAQQAEPVAWRFTGIAGLKRFMTQKQYEAQTPETKKWYEPFRCANCITSPQRQPLTDEEIEDLYFDRFSMGELKAFARAIEVAHGIKE
jgi:hypothetical protein